MFLAYKISTQKHLYEHLYEEVITESIILWVLPVGPIWDEPTPQKWKKSEKKMDKSNIKIDNVFTCDKKSL